MSRTQLARLRAWYAAKGIKHVGPDGDVLSCAPTAGEHHTKVETTGQPWTQSDWSKLDRNQGAWPDA